MVPLALRPKAHSEHGTPFLTARWESLVLLNWACPADVLEPLVPAGTDLDEWNGTHWLSLVGFMFRDTRVRSLPIPCHRTFEEVNLRFYVRRVVGKQIRRAVVFIRELVPRRAIAATARFLYNEPYLAVPMAHEVALNTAEGGTVRYSWSFGNRDYAIRARADGPARAFEHGSKAEFITEHYWGYTRQPDGSTLEYRVDHPSWLVWDGQAARFDGPAEQLYGNAIGAVMAGRPDSTYIAAGSEVSVYAGQRMR